MDNQPKRSFRPDPTPRRADGLKDRMRVNTPVRQAPPTNLRRPEPPKGEFVPQQPASEVKEAVVQSTASHTETESRDKKRQLPSVNLEGLREFTSKIPPRLNNLRSKLPHISKKVVFPAVLAIGAIILVSIVGFGTHYTKEVQSHKNPGVPAELKQKTGYTVLYPTKNDAAKVDESTFKFDSKDRLLSYIGRTPSNNKLIISQQAQPATMAAGQPAYDLLIKNMLGYKTFKSDNGDVNLTRPSQFQGDQFAVLRTKDSLLFIRPERDISDAQWAEIFNSFKPIN